MSATRLLVQPGTGITPLLEAIEQARAVIRIVIFRFDRGEIEAAIKRALRRGVFVHALVAHTSAGQGGAETLRRLEMRLLADGISVARTAADLIRYHDKLMIIDSKTLFLLGFNFTYLDIDRSRSFGIVTNEKHWVREAERLFAADTTRQPYTPECDTFVVSPGNSRQELASMLEAAEEQILIYDCKLSDPDIMRLLALKVTQGLDVRVIGGVGKRAAGVQVSKPHMRLHAQAVICDRKRMFLGSQSLRSLDLDARREVGLIIDEPAIVGQVHEVFEADWTHASKIRQVDPANPWDDLERWSSAEAPLMPLIDQPVAPQVVKSVVKEAIKDAILENVPKPSEVGDLRDAVKEAAKEALVELAT